MERFTSRPCVYQSDLGGILDMLLTYRAATSVRVYPTIWRVRLLLTSRVWKPSQDARVWEDTSGRIVGLAMLWRRQPTASYMVLDRFVRPDHLTSGLVAAMLQWGDQRATAIVAEQKTPLTLFAGAIAPSIPPDNEMESFGFTPVASDPNEYNVYFARSLQVDFPTPRLAPEYTIRPLCGLDELAAYQNLYGFAAVNPQHQREQLTSDEYSHLVVVDSKGGLAAYCECSICRAEWQISDERIGWIDYIETRPGQRQQGLGQAILVAGLAHLREEGAHTALLVTINTNTPAIHLYTKTGFERICVSESPSYEKHLPAP